MTRDPTDSRTVYYLAQSYRDAGKREKAADLYRMRTAMGGDEEEVWRSHLERARMLAIECESDFVQQELLAYSLRPYRAEPLQDLSRYFVQNGKPDVALLFAEKGLTIPKPERELHVVEESVYDYELREDYYVAAFYSQDHRMRGRDVCDSLALDCTVPVSVRHHARDNYYWYVDAVDVLMPSWQSKPLGFDPPTGYNPMNPSIARNGADINCVVRTISYWVKENGYTTATPDAPIITRNFLLDIDPDTLNDMLVYEIEQPVNWPPPLCDKVLGFEDIRLFAWCGDLWCSSTVCEQNAEGVPMMFLARVEGTLREWRQLVPEGTRRAEKNWMPVVSGDSLRFVYSCDPTRIVDERGKTIVDPEPSLAMDHFRGSTQLVPFGNGWLAVVHCKVFRNNHPCVYHRFVQFDRDFTIIALGPGFKFHTDTKDVREGYQYVAGMCWHPDDRHLLLSYCLDESRALVGKFDAADVVPLMRKVS